MIILKYSLDFGYHFFDILVNCAFCRKVGMEFWHWKSPFAWRHSCPLFRNKRFMLDEMLQILPYFWNTKTLEVFSFCVTIFFPLMNARHRPRNSLGKKLSSMKWRTKNYIAFCIPKIWQILNRFTTSFLQA